MDDLLGMGFPAAPAAPAAGESRVVAPPVPETSGCGAISALFFLDTKGRVLICRDYRGDIPLKCADTFIQKLNEADSESELRPVMYDDGVTYTYIQHNNLYVMACANTNVNAAAILLFLHRLCDVFVSYFNELDEEVLRDNFVIVYELLDEVMDFGYPQYCEAKILAEFIKTDAHAAEKSDVKAPMAVTNAVSWRQEGITYKKNEVFLDVVESVNLLVNSNGSVVRSEVCGALKMRAFLSGMPECKLGLNDKVLMESQGRAGGRGKAVDLEDMKFHQCVRLARFEKDRTIAFIPPDGAFDVMTYRLNTQVVRAPRVRSARPHACAHSASLRPLEADALRFLRERSARSSGSSAVSSGTAARASSTSSRPRASSRSARAPTRSRSSCPCTPTPPPRLCARLSAKRRTRPSRRRCSGRSSRCPVARSTCCAPSFRCPACRPTTRPRRSRPFVSSLRSRTSRCLASRCATSRSSPRKVRPQAFVARPPEAPPVLRLHDASVHGARADVGRACAGTCPLPPLLSSSPPEQATRRCLGCAISPSRAITRSACKTREASAFRSPARPAAPRAASRAPGRRRRALRSPRRTRWLGGALSVRRRVMGGATCAPARARGGGWRAPGVGHVVVAPASPAALCFLHCGGGPSACSLAGWLRARIRALA